MLKTVINILRKYSLFFLLVIGIISFNLYTFKGDYRVSENVGGISNYTKVINDKGIEENIRFDSSDLYSLGIWLKMNTLEDDIKVKLLDGSKTIYSGNIPKNDIKAGEAKEVTLKLNGEKGIKVQKNKSYTLVIKDNSKRRYSSVVYLNSQKKLWYKTTYKLLDSKTIKSAAILIEIIILSFWVYLIRFSHYRKRLSKFENQFLLVSVFLIVGYALFIPVYRAPDEAQHFARAYGVLHGIFLVDSSGNINIPNNLIPVVDVVNSNYIDTIKNLHVALSSQLSSTNIINMALYTPQSYVLQSLSIGIISIVTKNVLLIFYGSRILVGILCTLIIYYSIKYIPVGKEVLAICSLLPMNVAERASLSADGFTYTVVIALFSFVIYSLRNENNITNKMKVMMYILVFFLASCKVIYFILGFLVLLIPNKKFGSKLKGVCHKLISVIILMGVSVGWLKIASRYLVNTNGGASSSEKVMFMLKHPFNYIEIMNNTLWKNIFAHIEQMIVGPLGALNIEINSGILILLIVVLVRFCVFDFKLNLRVLFIWMLCLANVLLIYTSLYVQWTPALNGVSQITKIIGIQGRYFLPILPIMMVSFQLNKINNKDVSIVNDWRSIVSLLVINMLVLSNVIGFFAI